MVTIGLIALNVLAYLYQLSLEMSSQPLSVRSAADVSCLRLDPAVAAANPALAFVCELGAIPCRLHGPLRCARHVSASLPHGSRPCSCTVASSTWAATCCTSGSSQQRRGHARPRALPLLLPSVGRGGLRQTFFNAGSAVPMIGASGAVSGVLGAYLLLFPYATVLTLVMFGFFIRFIHIPALFVLGFWIVLQFLQGYLSLGAADGGGVAFLAHVGGFVGHGPPVCHAARRDGRL